MVKYLVLGRQVRAILAERPFEVPRGEHRVRLVQAYIGVNIDPHATDARPTIDQNHLLVARHVPAGCEQGVQPGDSGSDDANVGGFYRRGLGCGHRATFLLASIMRTWTTAGTSNRLLHLWAA